jgi:hypothetical protein
VTGNGPYSTASGNNPGGYLPTAGGAYQWVVVYSGDANNQSTTSPFGAESETVNNDADLDLTNMPPNISKIASSSAGATVTYTSPTAVDEAGDSPAATVGCGPASGSVFPIGTTTVTCGATDSDDTNSPVSKSFTVTVRYGVKLLYKAPMSGKVGSAVPIKIELVSASGQNLSSSSLTVNALCVVVQGAKDCSGSAPMSFGGGSPFTFMASLDNGGGYQFNAKTTSLTIGKTYQLLFRVAGEDSTSFHADAGATFTLTK